MKKRILAIFFVCAATCAMMAFCFADKGYREIKKIKDVNDDSVNELVSQMYALADDYSPYAVLLGNYTDDFAFKIKQEKELNRALSVNHLKRSEREGTKTVVPDLSWVLSRYGEGISENLYDLLVLCEREFCINVYDKTNNVIDIETCVEEINYIKKQIDGHGTDSGYYLTRLNYHLFYFEALAGVSHTCFATEDGSRYSTDMVETMLPVLYKIEDRELRDTLVKYYDAIIENDYVPNGAAIEILNGYYEDMYSVFAEGDAE